MVLELDFVLELVVVLWVGLRDVLQGPVLNVGDSAGYCIAHRLDMGLVVLWWVDSVSQVGLRDVL